MCIRDRHRSGEFWKLTFEDPCKCRTHTRTSHVDAVSGGSIPLCSVNSAQRGSAPFGHVHMVGNGTMWGGEIGNKCQVKLDGSPLPSAEKVTADPPGTEVPTVAATPSKNKVPAAGRLVKQTLEDALRVRRVWPPGW
eukprot:1615954-Prymnesium_polylepis.3